MSGNDLLGDWIHQESERCYLTTRLCLQCQRGLQIRHNNVRVLFGIRSMILGTRGSYTKWTAPKRKVYSVRHAVFLLIIAFLEIITIRVWMPMTVPHISTQNAASSRHLLLFHRSLVATPLKSYAALLWTTIFLQEEKFNQGFLCLFILPNKQTKSIVTTAGARPAVLLFLWISTKVQQIASKKGRRGGGAVK